MKNLKVGNVRWRPLLLVLSLLADAAAASAYSQDGVADMALMGVRIYTQNPSRAIAEALAVKDGKLLVIGSVSEVKRRIGRGTRVVQGHGRSVLPGLIDAHIHPTLMIDFPTCNLHGRVMPLSGIAQTLKACLSSAPVRAGDWVYVTLWEYGAGNDPDPAHRNLRAMLDAVAPSNPVFMIGTDGHHAAFNSLALARAKSKSGETVGLSRKTLATDFSEYRAFVGVDEHGEPSGDVNDQARDLMDTSAIKLDQHRKLMQQPERIMQSLASRGITAVQDAWTHDTDFEVYNALIAKGQLTVWLNMAQYHRPQDYADAKGDVDYRKLFEKADALRAKYSQNPLTRADAIKVFADGVTESNPNTVPPTLGDSPKLTPYLQPIFGRDADNLLTVRGYVDPSSPECVYARTKPAEFSSDETVAGFTKRYGYHPGQCAISYGTPAQDPAVFSEYIKQAHLRGYTLHIHAISDSAVRMSLDAIEAARAADGISSQPDALAHVEFAAPVDVVRMGKDHLYLAYTYSWAYADPTGYDMSLVPFYDHVQGNSFAAMHDPKSYFEQTYYPFKTSKDSGAILIAGSDAPVSTEDPQPFVNMEFALTRAKRGLSPTAPWQRLSIEEVLDAYTINGARSLGRDTQIGSLEVGKSADFCVLSEDPVALAARGRPAQVGDIRVLQTWFRGRKIYDAGR